jgi:ribokinase
MSLSVCVVGSLNVDLTFRSARLPSPGETLAAHGFQIGPGGKGANQAVMAARLGATVTMVGRVGVDSFGQHLLHTLREQGVGTEYVGIDATLPTGAAGILVDDAARNCILVAAGANGSLTPDRVRAAADAIRAARVLLCQLEIPVESTLEAFRIAREAKVCTILTPAPVQEVPEELLRLTDVCVLNETEADCLVGTGRGPDAVARALRQRGPAVVIVTLGERGCILSGSESDGTFAAPTVTAVDTTGAGDAFVGALAVELAGRIPLSLAIPRAIAAAALSVTRPGAQASYPSRAEVEAFLSAQAARH